MIATKLDITNPAEIQRNGLAALKDALGVTATIRFLEQFDKGGSDDYTEEKYLVLVRKWVGMAIWSISQLPLCPYFYGNSWCQLQLTQYLSAA